MKLYRILISNPFGNRWISKRAISEKSARIMATGGNWFVVRIEEVA